MPLLDSPLPLELDDNLFDQLAELSGANFPVAVIPTTAPPIAKYTEEDLQQILKTVLEARAPTISEEP